MKRNVLFGTAVLLGTGLLVGCRAAGPGNLRVHEVDLYGSDLVGTQTGQLSRMAWVYGTLNSGSGNASSSIKLGGAAADLRPQVTDPLATPGSLSVNGQAVYRVAGGNTSPKLSLTRDAAQGTFQVAALNGASLAAVYYNDGQGWYKLGGTSGTQGANRSNGLRGAGQLTDAEADALSASLAGRSNVAVAVLNDPQPGLSVEPAPAETLRTSLYILGDVPFVGTQTTATVTTTPTNTTPAPSTTTSPSNGGSLNFTEVARGSNSSATEASARSATTAAEAGSLYTLAYGRQTSRPTPPALAGDTLVGIFAGQFNTGGYGIKVDGVQASGSSLTVQVTLTSPGAGMITTQALTSPWVIVRVPGQFQNVQVVDSSGRSW